MSNQSEGQRPSTMEMTISASEERHSRLVIDMLDTNHTSSRRIRGVTHVLTVPTTSKKKLPNTAVETTARKGVMEPPSIVPRKRKIDDGNSLNPEKTLPPRRWRKINKVNHPQEGNAVNNDLRSNVLGTTGTSTTLNTETIGDLQNERTKLQSSFALQKPVTTGSMHSRLASLLDQCRETLERASQHQHHQEEHTRQLQLNDREEVARLKRKLDQTTSMLFQEREALARSRDELTQMTTKFEGERDARIAVASQLAEESALVKQLRSDLEKEQRNVQDEKVNSEKLLAERAGLASELEKARVEQQKSATAHSDALRQSIKATEKLKATIEEQDVEIEALKDKHTQMYEDLVSEQLKCALSEDHNAEVKRRFIAFHFGANILTTYLLMMLRQHSARCVSIEREAVDDEHNLWDVQAALKRLVDGCTSFVESFPDREDFYHYAECPLCIPESSPVATPSKQVFVRIKKEPKDVRLSGPSHRVAC